MNARQRRKTRQRKVRTLKERVDDHLALCRLRGQKLPDRERLLQHLQHGGTIADYAGDGFRAAAWRAQAKWLSQQLDQAMFKALVGKDAVMTVHDEVGLMPRGDDLVDAVSYLNQFPILKPDAVVKISLDT